jgi:hypothetical protein
MISSTINSRRTAIVAAAAAVALGAASLTGVANAAGASDETTGSVSGISSDGGGANADTGSLTSDSVGEFFESEAVQAGGVLILGLGVAAALAIGAGIQGGAFNDVQLPF